MAASKDALRLSLSKLPSFPPIASQVMGMLATGDASTKALVSLIQKDPVFAAEVLRLANSAAFSTYGNISRLAQAISHVGISRLRSLTMTVALRSVMNAAFNRAIVRQCWAHSLATGLIAKRFSRPAAMDENESYTLGLLHDVGRLGLLAAFTGEYGDLLERDYASQEELLAAEESQLGADHCTAGVWVAEHWGLPEALRQVAASHHQVPADDTPAPVCFIRLSCRLADCLGFSCTQAPPDPVEHVLSGEAPGLARAVERELPDLNATLLSDMRPLWRS